MIPFLKSIPLELMNTKVEPYYRILKSRFFALVIKRLFDIVFAIVLLVVFSPLLILISITIVIDSSFPIVFRQKRITQFGREFKILKFRTMVVNAESIGAKITSKNDPRITKIGQFLRKYRLDELPQLINIIAGDMSFVGTRPEVPKYVSAYSDEMKATLLLPAGVTSEASINFKDEEKLLASAENIDEVYLQKILPEKMKYNLQSLRDFSLSNDIKTLLRTVFAVAK